MLRLLKFILLLIIIIGASVGATMWFTSRDSAPGNPAVASAPVQVPQAPVEPPMVPTPIFAALEPFTVTLYGETRNRILYTAITLRMGDEASRQQITDYMPEVRDRILKVLSAQPLALIQTPEGRQALADSLKVSLARPFAAQLPGPQIADVLFTAFVVQ
ncbi:MAG: flagellar basal body-associated FliL family protein [Castellaniella sp.]|uniref:flagellar basal body-associated FliL family protein n=1 Tax=Castellaniella sp. TaxID=1955812 RepID=UPI002A35907E|nr:flagellar basal body-associated FliL family protein [Castellaniella sp.]MDY0310412.1 flagellar basal body-associated FliL family protein [Castellaniella sp.]